MIHYITIMIRYFTRIVIIRAHLITLKCHTMIIITFKIKIQNINLNT